MPLALPLPARRRQRHNAPLWSPCANAIAAPAAEVYDAAQTAANAVDSNMVIAMMRTAASAVLKKRLAMTGKN